MITANYSAAVRPARPGAIVRAAVPGAARTRTSRSARTSRTRHVTGTPTRPRAPASRSTSAACPGSGILNGTVWHDADFDDVARCQRARAAKAGRSSCTATAAGASRRLTDATGAYRISGVAPNYLTPATLRAALPRAGRGRQHGVAGPRRLRSSRTACSASATSRPVRQQPAEPQPADRPERRRLQLDLARADRRARR